MTLLLLAVLLIIGVILWQRVEALQLRVYALELEARGPEQTAFQQQERVDPPLQESRQLRREPRPERTPFAEPPLAFAMAESEPPEAAEEQTSTWPDEIAAAQPAQRFGFEDIFGRYLPIWAGGITLTVAGFLIVKYSIDAGLLSPAVRVIFGLLFGTGLIAGAELALRRDDIARDPRIRQALSGAGIATLYASVLVAANLYHLIGPITAFGGLAVTTLLAALLSMRFGAPSAVLGLIGGLAAPALVGSTASNVSLLASWLALTVGGLSVLGRRQRWWWLGALAVAGGFGWGILLIASELHDAAATLSVGTLTLLLSILFPLLFVGREGRILRVGAALAGCAQMAAIVTTGGFVPLDWGLFALISVALVWLSRRDAMLADSPVVGLGTGILLTMTWPLPRPMELATVLTVGALIYGVPAAWRLWRSNGRLSDAVQIAIIALAAALVPAGHFWSQTDRGDFAPLALLGAVIASGTAILGWRNATRKEDSRFAMLSTTGIGMTAIAAALVAPVWALAPVAAIAAIVALLSGRVAADSRIGGAAGAFAIAALVLLVAYDPNQIVRTIGLSTSAIPLPAVVRWTIVAIAAFVFARWSEDAPVRRAAEALSALLLYVVAAQILPPLWLALVPAGMMAALALTDRNVPLPALAVTAGLAAGWAVQPMLIWTASAGGALMGVPFFVTGAPGIDGGMIRIAAPAAALIVLFWRGVIPARLREGIVVTATILAFVAVHIAWKQAFAIADMNRFAMLGMAERTLWEALLAGAMLVAWCLGGRRIAIGLGLASLLHFFWFTLLLHNPLWSEQLAGPWLVPAYGIAFTLIWLSARVLPDAGRIRDSGRMALILLLATSLLRQLFHGSLLSETGVSQAEDICRSLLAIAIAIGFLQWGIRRAARDWRIASLALMLAAVGKVFLFDAAGLDGLMRITSFAALGFSLIGVGWLYSRYLPDATEAVDR